MRHILLSLFICSGISLHANQQHDALAHAKQFGTQSEIIAAYENAIKNRPSDSTLQYEFGTYLADLDRPEYYEKAWHHLHHAIAINPQMNWLFSYGVFCSRIGKIEDALNAYIQLLERNKSLASVLYNCGYCLKLSGDLQRAIGIYKKVLALNPDHEQAHLALAFAYLGLGEYAHGWKAHEWNLKKQGKFAPELRTFIQNNSIANKVILLLPEGGLGDTIQFIRYAQRLKQMGAIVRVAVQNPLIPLFSNCPFIDSLHGLNEPRPSCHAYATLMSLPAIFADDEMTIPQNIPYIFPPQERIDYWAAQLQSTKKFKIGICWQPDIHNDSSRLPIARRGIALSHFIPMGNNPKIQLYSLQQKDGIEQIEELHDALTLHTFDHSFDVDHGSFIDTAAVMHSLDLIITTDTATAHLAGALGKDVWLLLPFSTDWRWIHSQKNSPWYPTMRIFKQPHPFDWESVMQEICKELSDFMQ